MATMEEIIRADVEAQLECVDFNDVDESGLLNFTIGKWEILADTDYLDEQLEDADDYDSSKDISDMYVDIVIELVKEKGFSAEWDADGVWAGGCGVWYFVKEDADEDEYNDEDYYYLARWSSGRTGNGYGLSILRFDSEEERDDYYERYYFTGGDTNRVCDKINAAEAWEYVRTFHLELDDASADE